MSRSSDIIIHGVYQHYKGDYYIVEDIATHTESGEDLVLYRALYEDGKLWARPKPMFLEEIKPGQTRFTLQNIKSVHKHSQN